MSNWLDKIVPTVVRTKTVERKASVPDGLWSKCGACEWSASGAPTIIVFSHTAVDAPKRSLFSHDL